MFINHRFFRQQLIEQPIKRQTKQPMHSALQRDRVPAGLHHWLLRATLFAVLLARPAVGAAPSGQDDFCFWNPVTRQCTADEMLYAQPVAGLDAAQKRLFDDGIKQFRAPWTVFPRADG